MPPRTPRTRPAVRSEEELDRAVNKAVRQFQSGVSADQFYAILLAHIVLHSNNGLDSYYQDADEANMLIDSNENLQKKLTEAWNKKEYGEIRKLGACLHVSLPIFC